MKRSSSTLLFVFLISIFSHFTAAQSPEIRQYLKIRSAGSPTFSPDAKKIAYLTNVTGTSQVWVTNVEGGEPTQLTFFDENVNFVKWLGDGSGIVFGMATGGDENTQFYWMQPDGTAVEKLTDDPKVRHNFGKISADGKTIYYTSNKRDRNFFDVYSMDIDSGKAAMLYKFDGSLSIAAINDAGTKIIISRNGTEKSLDNDLYLVDLKTKKGNPSDAA